MSRTRVFAFHKRFKERYGEVKDDYRSGRPTTSTTVVSIELVRQVVFSDCRLTVRKIAIQLAMKKDDVWKIITKDLGKRKVCAKIMPRRLNYDKRHPGESGHQLVFSKLDLLSRHYWWKDMDFWIWTEDQVPEQSVEVFDVVETKKRKTVKAKVKDYVLRCKEYRQQRVLTSKRNDQSGSWLEGPAAYASLTARG